VTGTSPGGPYNQLKFFDDGGERKLGFKGRPQVIFRLVK
jgi:hypothetical protein